MKKKHILNRKKTDPDVFIFTGDVNDDKIDIQLFTYNESDCTEITKLSPDDIAKFDNTGHRYWLNIYGLSSPHIIAQICKKFNVHDLVIQDILDINQRPKYQEFDSFAFLTMKATSQENLQRTAVQISFIFGDNFIITFQERPAGFFGHLRVRLRDNKGIIRQRGADYLLYTMLEAILDDYFAILQSVENDLDNLNVMTLDTDPKPILLAAIEKQKKFALRIKKIIQPIKEFSHSMERGESKFIETRHLKYFYEIQDLCLTLQDSCDSIISSLESSTNLFFSLQSHRMNQVIQTLTIVTTIFIPITFIAGLYGMNFSYMPELGWKYGYLAVWLVIIITTISMIVYFKMKRWF